MAPTRDAARDKTGRFAPRPSSFANLFVPRDLGIFEERWTEPTDHGDDFETWREVFREWVLIQPASGDRTVINGQQVVERGADVITMRYRSDVNTNMRIRVDNTIFGIVRIVDRGWRHEWLDVETVARDVSTDRPGEPLPGR